MSDDALDAFDPLLPEFVLQHDFRERFFHALEEIVEVLDADDMTSEQRLVKIGILARGALDHESIKVWLDANRPMPWLDERVGATVEVRPVGGGKSVVAVHGPRA